MNVWPATLPQSILYAGASEKMGDVRLKTQTESGPGKSRPMYSMAVDTLSCAMVLTLVQKELLKTFVRQTSRQGTLPFTFPKPQGASGETITALFDELPTFTPARPGRNAQTPLWKVSFSLKVMPA